MFDDLKERMSAAMAAALSPRTLVLAFLDDKLGIQLDPTAHPADNLADLVNHFGGDRSNVTGAEVDRAMENSKFMIKSLAAVDKAKVSAVVGVIASEIRGVDPEKVRALMRAFLATVSTDGGQHSTGTVGNGSLGSGGSDGESGGRDGDGSLGTSGSGPH